MSFDIPNYVLFAMILGEWCYLIYWSQTAGKRVVGQVIRAVLNLRTGRGKNPPAAQGIADHVSAQTEAAEPTLDDIDLDSPLAQKFIAQLSERTGVPVSQLRSLAGEYLGSGPDAPSNGSPRIPRPSGEGNTASGGNIVAQLLQGFVSGNLGLEEAIAAGAPLLVSALANKQQGGGGGQGGGAGYW